MTLAAAVLAGALRAVTRAVDPDAEPSHAITHTPPPAITALTRFTAPCPCCGDPATWVTYQLTPTPDDRQVLVHDIECPRSLT